MSTKENKSYKSENKMCIIENWIVLDKRDVGSLYWKENLTLCGKKLIKHSK